jgi:hypothetical protein
MDPPHHIFVRSAGLVADGFESQNGTVLSTTVSRRFATSCDVGREDVAGS